MKDLIRSKGSSGRGTKYFGIDTQIRRDPRSIVVDSIVVVDPIVVGLVGVAHGFLPGTPRHNPYYYINRLVF